MLSLRQLAASARLSQKTSVVPALCRAISSTAPKNLATHEKSFKDLPNLRHLPRAPYKDIDHPVIDPKEKYKVQVEELHKFGKYLIACMPKYIQQFSVWKDELTIYVAPSALTNVAIFIRDHTPAQFKACMDVTCADYPTRTFRFDVCYEFLSVRFNSRIRIKTYASEVSPVPSLVPLFAGVNWFERETYDLFEKTSQQQVTQKSDTIMKREESFTNHWK
ncbi:unnamed protein product [Ambrosiozyma monospora]|uniref:Unnamed protein product n=1 Tax=Ambrosiozyma monospora TaxID=43982 RepID=A0ACB5UAY3_AMBMO|nr:unnamed protein product [Ambrosiozyma monospora]